MAAWYVLQGILAAIALVALGFIIRHEVRVHRARKALTAAMAKKGSTLRRLDAAKAEGRAVLRAVSDTPIFEELATERLRDDLGRWGA